MWEQGGWLVLIRENVDSQQVSSNTFKRNSPFKGWKRWRNISRIYFELTTTATTINNWKPTWLQVEESVLI